MTKLCLLCLTVLDQSFAAHQNVCPRFRWLKSILERWMDNQEPVFFSAEKMPVFLSDLGQMEKARVDKASIARILALLNQLVLEQGKVTDTINKFHLALQEMVSRLEKLRTYFHLPLDDAVGMEDSEKKDKKDKEDVQAEQNKKSQTEGKAEDKKNQNEKTNARAEKAEQKQQHCCPVCHKSFTRKDSLDRHRKTVQCQALIMRSEPKTRGIFTEWAAGENANRCVCEQCGHCFNQPSDCQRHMDSQVCAPSKRCLCFCGKLILPSNLAHHLQYKCNGEKTNAAQLALNGIGPWNWDAPVFSLPGGINLSFQQLLQLGYEPPGKDEKGSKKDPKALKEDEIAESMRLLQFCNQFRDPCELARRSMESAWRGLLYDVFHFFLQRPSAFDFSDFVLWNKQPNTVVLDYQRSKDMLGYFASFNWDDVVQNVRPKFPPNRCPCCPKTFSDSTVCHSHIRKQLCHPDRCCICVCDKRILWTNFDQHYQFECPISIAEKESLFRKWEANRTLEIARLPNGNRLSLQSLFDLGWQPPKENSVNCLKSLLVFCNRLRLPELYKR